MQMNIHLNFNGNCEEAFSFYEKVFGQKREFKMTYSEAPQGAPIPADWGGKIMHTSLKLGSGLLMGCDAPKEGSSPIGGFQVSVESEDEAEVKRIYNSLVDGGAVVMPLAPTFWSPLFGMCNDKFGVGWMIASTARIDSPTKS